jgi:hypothetical protein
MNEREADQTEDAVVTGKRVLRRRAFTSKELVGLTRVILFDVDTDNKEVVRF